ncbi:MAG TPA: glutamate-1-semialdehyde 2,1-aminomutase [Gammaproteobacteria bacterium]|nr:glutamate-1-semialdehyde 2,1-aminomutase [Gammaproteobacteria bacterium]
MNENNKWYQEALQCFPGGVNSPVRSFQSVKQSPKCIQRAKGSYVWDVDNVRYLDYVGGFGPAILGHAHPAVCDAVDQAMRKGSCYGANHPDEVRLAKLIQESIPVERVRFVSSGTEACMSLLRLARGYTQRNKVIKFMGGYHGHVDALLAKAGSGVLQHAHPSSPGIPSCVTEDTLLYAYNDLAGVQEVLSTQGDEIACVFVEPIAGNMGMILPQEGFLQGLREACDQSGTLLIFDEVMTGFRVDARGAFARYGVMPDLWALGKVIGGGLPLAAFGGSAEIMNCLSPAGAVYQAGTLSGNPVAVAAGMATLEELKHCDYAALEQESRLLVEGLEGLAREYQVPFQGVYAGGMFGFFFVSSGVHSYEGIHQEHQQRFTRFHQSMLEQGIYFAPSAYEAGFLSFCHGEEERKMTLDAARIAFAKVKEESIEG